MQQVEALVVATSFRSTTKLRRILRCEREESEITGFFRSEHAVVIPMILLKATGAVRLLDCWCHFSCAVFMEQQSGIQTGSGPVRAG